MTALNTEREAGAGPRIDYVKVAPGALQAQRGLENYIRNSGLEHSLIHLMKLRASYVNLVM